MKKKISLQRLLDKPVTISEKFHEKTKIKKASAELDSKYWPEEWKKVYYKGYSRLEEIRFPLPHLSAKASLMNSLKNRASIRQFSKKPLSIKTLSSLLYFSSGMQNSKNIKRFYPSAGARYPLEIYVLSLNTTLPKGLYHYYIKSHSLEKLLALEKIDINHYFNQTWIRHAACIIIITAVFKRNSVKYGDRGYRYIFIEAGHLAQNLYLISSALDLACCANESFVDDKLNNLLDIDGINEAAIYTLAFGNKK